MKKWILSLLLCLVVVFCVLPAEANAEIVAEGTCGKNLAWVLDGEGTLTISGTGAIRSYYINSHAPWYAHKDQVKTVVINEGVTNIGDYAFDDCSSLTGIMIPTSVTSIGSSAFEGCSSLTSVTIPASVTSIGGRAFRYCSSLTNVTIPEGVANIGSQAFCGCRRLTSVTIPEGVASIGSEVFRYCSNLTSITIPTGVTSIGNYAFSGCSSLTSVTIPAGVTSIGDGAFYDCSSLASVTIPAGATSIGKSAFKECSSLTNVTILEGITSIGERAFSGCSNLTSVTIPTSVTKIGNEAFRVDGIRENLKEVHISDIAAWCAIRFSGPTANPLYRGATLYCGGQAITNLEIPAGVTSIGQYAFDGCSSLISVTIPTSVTSIGDLAFYYCGNLSSVTISEGVTRIEDSAFASFNRLTIKLPKSVQRIGEKAISGAEHILYAGSKEEWNAIVKKAVSSTSVITYNYVDGMEYHTWADATCAAPKTCSVCGATEGEPIAHSFADGKCTVCGAADESYVPGEVLYGDANGDGKINAKDAMLVLQYYTKKITEDKLDLKAVDVDGNGKINAKDAMLVLQFYTKKIEVFPVQAK